MANTALRWIPPFLPTLEVAFGATTTQLTTILGASEFAGMSTLAVGDHLDRGRERAVMVTSLGLVTLSSLIALARIDRVVRGRLRAPRARCGQLHGGRSRLDQPPGRLPVAGAVDRHLRDLVGFGDAASGPRSSPC